MNKEEYFKLVKKINKAVKSEGFNYVRCFSEPRKKGTGYRTKLWAAGNGKAIVEYINKEFGDQVEAELLEPGHHKVQTVIDENGHLILKYGYYYQGGVIYRPLKKISNSTTIPAYFKTRLG